MDVKILDEKNGKLVLKIEGIEPAFANVIRRTIMSDIPVMAVDFIDMEKNNSAFFDEALAHRIAMIPLKFPNTYNLREECSCDGKGCSNCEVVLVIDKKGPCVVKAGDLKTIDELVTPADPEIPITYLDEKQSLKLEATAILGFGTNHSKWQAAVVGYRMAPVIKVDADKVKNKKATADSCPKKVYDSGLKIVNKDACNLCMRCVEISQDGIKVSANPSSYIFTIESVCGLDNKTLINRGLDRIQEKAELFLKVAGKDL